jgi:hypothetical protein
VILETAIAAKAGVGLVPALAVGAAASVAAYLGWKRYKASQRAKVSAQWSARTVSGSQWGGFPVPPGS